MQPFSPHNPHRPLVANGAEGSAAGHLTIKTKGGESCTTVRVLQESERLDANMRRVRWVFSEGNDTFQIELRHGRASGLRKIYVNREPVERVRYGLLGSLLGSKNSSHEFDLKGRGGTEHRARLIISKERGLDYTYQLLIDDAPIQLVSKADDCLDTPRAPAAASPVSPGVRRSSSFGRRDTATKKLFAEILSTYHVVCVDKSLGEVGMTVSNSESVLPDSNRKLGVTVYSLEAEGLAYQQGLRAGDLIMAVNDKYVSTHQDAVAAIDEADGAVSLRVWGLRPSREIVLHKLEGEILGVTLTRNERGPGVLVCALKESGQTLRRGVRVGDVLLSVNGTAVGHHSRAVSLLDDARGDIVCVFMPCKDDVPQVVMRGMEA